MNHYWNPRRAIFNGSTGYSLCGKIVNLEKECAIGKDVDCAECQRIETEIVQPSWKLVDCGCTHNGCVHQWRK